MDNLLSEDLSLRHLPDVSYDASISFQLPASSSVDDQLLGEDNFLQGADVSFTTPLPQRTLHEPLTLEHLTPYRPPHVSPPKELEPAPAPQSIRKTRASRTPAPRSPLKYPFKIPKEEEPITPSRLDLLRNEVEMLNEDIPLVTYKAETPESAEQPSAFATAVEPVSQMVMSIRQFFDRKGTFQNIAPSVTEDRTAPSNTSCQYTPQHSFGEDDSSLLDNDGAAGRLMAYSNAISLYVYSWPRMTRCSTIIQTSFIDNQGSQCCTNSRID
jgi:hypothetical protein